RRHNPPRRRRPACASRSCDPEFWCRRGETQIGSHVRSYVSAKGASGQRSGRATICRKDRKNHLECLQNRQALVERSDPSHGQLHCSKTRHGKPASNHTWLSPSRAGGESCCGLRRSGSSGRSPASSEREGDQRHWHPNLGAAQTSELLLQKIPPGAAT